MALNGHTGVTVAEGSRLWEEGTETIPYFDDSAISHVVPETESPLHERNGAIPKVSSFLPDEQGEPGRRGSLGRPAPVSVANKLSRGTFSASFFFAAMKAIGRQTVNLEEV
jgi:hypothetical protein